VTILAELDPSLLSFPGSGSVFDDYEDVHLPAWSSAAPRSPNVVPCYVNCNEHIMIKAVPSSDPDFNGAGGGLTFPDGNSGRLMTHRTIKIVNTMVVNHSCGAVDDGCSSPQKQTDGRKIPSHELGHALGIGHCDLDLGVMCGINVNSSAGTDDGAGLEFWTPQQRDNWALKAMYP
jgi:hypothetical protein